MALRSDGWRRRRRRPVWRDFTGIMRSRGARISIAVAVSALLLTYVGVRLNNFYLSSTTYADMGVGDRRQDVLYGVGAPSEVRGASGGWRKAAGADMNAAGWAYGTATGGRVEVSFDAATGKAHRIACFEVDAQPFACAPLFRVGLDTDEETLLLRLGAPTTEHLAGEVKVMTYSDIGAEYALKRYKVYSISALHNRSGGLSRVVRFVHNLIP